MDKSMNSLIFKQPSETNDRFFYYSDFSNEQLGTFSKLDMALYSAKMFGWEADLSSETIMRTDLANGINDEWTFDKFLACVHENDIEKLEKALRHNQEDTRKVVDIDVRIKSEGKLRWYRIKGMLYHAIIQNRVFAAGVAYDINNAKAHIEQLEYIKERDILTGLYNVRKFESRFADISQCGISPRTLVVANIDNLKEINGSLGYNAGNTMIKNVAHVIKDCFYDADMVARISGGEYCAAFSGKDQLEIDLKIKEAGMQLHKIYINLMKTEVTFGYAVSSGKNDFCTLYRHAMESMQKNKDMKKILAEVSVVDRLNEIISIKTGWGKRVKRLQSISAQVARVLDCSDEDMQQIKALAKICEIGLIGLDDRLLKSRTQIGGRDLLDYMDHVKIGLSMIAGMNEYAVLKRPYADIYKRYDEAGEDMALTSRIIAGAIAFDDMLSAGAAVRFDTVREMLQKQKGETYCPKVVDAIIRVMCKHYA